MKLHNIYYLSQTMSNAISKPKNITQGHMTRCHKDGISPRHHTTTPSRIYLSPLWVAGDNVPRSTSFACGLLALPSLTHTLKDLPLPPWEVGNDA